MRRHLFPLALVIAAAAIAADDPAGWSKSRWGMTDDEILQAFDGQAVRLATPERNGARVSIPSVELAGTKFHVWFIPDKSGHLCSVVFTSIDPPSDSIAQSIEELLAAKYGHPWKTQATHTTDALWTIGTTVIRVTHTRLRGFQMLVLRYSVQSSDPI